jgi:hypothetical protein
MTSRLASLALMILSSKRRSYSNGLQKGFGKRYRDFTQTEGALESFTEAEGELDDLTERVEELETRFFKNGTASNGIGVVYALGMAIAVTASWSRHVSVLWSMGEGLLSWLYVIYFALTRSSFYWRSLLGAF